MLPSSGLCEAHSFWWALVKRTAGSTQLFEYYLAYDFELCDVRT